MVVYLIVGLVAVTSSLDSVIIPQAAHDLGVSEVSESFGAIGSFLLGFGPGALVSGPFSEVLGRNQIYVPALTLFCLFIMASRLVPNIGGQKARSFLGSLPVSWVLRRRSTSDEAYPTCSRRWRSHTCSRISVSLALEARHSVLSWVLGLQSSVLHSWGFAEWFTLMLAGAILSMTLFFPPEAYAPVLLSWKARDLRKITGVNRFYAEHEIERIPLLARLKTALKGPFILLISFYLSLVCIILFTFLKRLRFHLPPKLRHLTRPEQHNPHWNISQAWVWSS